MTRNRSRESWKIVLVDDAADVLYVHEHLLMKMGHRVISFVSPLEALAYIQANRDGVDMLVTDFKMPELDGLQLIRQVRKIHPALPTLILSAFSEDSALATVATAFKACVMAKPVRFAQIKAHIDTLQAEAEA